ncbi:hypothetical protein TcWFU_008306 [Taenia crassiceps]|uniref:Uncharacterized protein n=1 Tax=Taenia crassiceps TaxID=6207 RepID=A0ABR4Q2R2_9CEST
MALHFSLLASVAAIMTWVIRTENGGLLNVLFRIVPSATHRDHQHDHQHDHDVHFELINQVDAAVVDFFKQMLLLKPLPLPILQVMPESLGGGQSGVDNAHANPNRGADIFWITVFTFLLVTGLIILTQVINCWCYKRRDMHGLTNALQMAVLRANITNKQFILRIVYIAVLLLTLVFLAISIILVIVYISSTGLVVSYLATQPQVPAVGNQTPASLPDGLHSTISHASAFLTKGIAMGRDLTNRTLHHFVDRIYAKMHGEIGAAIERLLAHTAAPNALERGEKSAQVLQAFSTHVFDAYGNVTLLRNDIASLEASLHVLRTDLSEALGKVKNCNGLATCKRLKTSLANVVSPIASSKIDVRAMKAYTEQLDKIIADLTRLLKEVRDSLTNLRATVDSSLNALKAKLNLPQTLDQIEAFWSDAQSHASDLLSQLNETLDSVETQLPKHVRAIQVGCSVVGGVFVLMMATATLIAVRLLYQSIRYRLYANPNTVCLSTDSTKSKWDDVVCGKSAVCCCSVLFIPLLLVFAATIAAILFLLTTISSEGCIYLERESAVKMTDFVVNGYMARQWKPFIRSAVNRNADFLKIPPPKNLLFALTRTCNPEAPQQPLGLLSALGYHNLVDVPKLLHSREVADAIQQGRKAVREQVKGLNIAALLPSEGELDKLPRLLRGPIAQVSLSALLKETDPAKMDTSLLENLLQEMERLSGYASAAKVDITKSKKSLAQAINSTHQIRSRLEQIHRSLQKLDSEKSTVLVSLGELLNALSASRDAAETTKVRLEVERQYDNLVTNLITYMRVDGEKTFTKLTGSLFPCVEAHAAYSAAIGVTCGETGGVRLLLGLSYVLALNVLFLTLLYFALFSLAFCQALQIRMLSDITAADYNYHHRRHDDDSIAKFK